jgi:hypothetical protein
MLARESALRCLRASLSRRRPELSPAAPGSEVAGRPGSRLPPDPERDASARTWFQRRYGHRIQPKGTAMNDYEVICKGIVIIGSLQLGASAVRS